MGVPVIELPDLPVPIEEMFFYATKRSGAWSVIGGWNYPNEWEGQGTFIIGTYRDRNSARAALGEIGTLQAAIKALLK